MALEPIDPFTYQDYVRITGDAPLQIINIFENHERGGWYNALTNYNYNGNYITGINIRGQFHNALVNAVGEQRLDMDVVNNILDWGGMNRLGDDMQIHLQRSLHILNNLNHNNYENVYSGRIALMSKIYEMWHPANWVIYDSYCARGLQWLVSQWWNLPGNYNTYEDILRLPSPPGRAIRPVDGFPRLNTQHSLQATLGFIYASWLCRAIATQLNIGGNHAQDITWQAYHIEMVAFQLGHEV